MRIGYTFGIRQLKQSLALIAMVMKCSCQVGQAYVWVHESIKTREELLTHLVNGYKER